MSPPVPTWLQAAADTGPRAAEPGSRHTSLSSGGTQGRASSLAASTKAGAASACKTPALCPQTVDTGSQAAREQAWPNTVLSRRAQRSLRGGCQNPGLRTCTCSGKIILQPEPASPPSHCDAGWWGRRGQAGFTERAQPAEWRPLRQLPTPHPQLHANFTHPPSHLPGLPVGLGAAPAGVQTTAPRETSRSTAHRGLLRPTGNAESPVPEGQAVPETWGAGARLLTPSLSKGAPVVRPACTERWMVAAGPFTSTGGRAHPPEW